MSFDSSYPGRLSCLLVSTCIFTDTGKGGFDWRLFSQQRLVQRRPVNQASRQIQTDFLFLFPVQPRPAALLTEGMNGSTRAGNYGNSHQNLAEAE